MAVGVDIVSTVMPCVFIYEWTLVQCSLCIAGEINHYSGVICLLEHLLASVKRQLLSAIRIHLSFVSWLFENQLFSLVMCYFMIIFFYQKC